MPLPVARRLPLSEQPAAAPEPLYPKLFTATKPRQQFSLGLLQFFYGQLGRRFEQRIFQ